MMWEEAANRLINDGYNVLSEDEDDCFYCPECGEPIYKEDFSQIEISKSGQVKCPICEVEL